MIKLWIRSQDRKKLILATHLFIQEYEVKQHEVGVAVDKTICKGYDIQNKSTFLGRYKTEERAQEILDKIQKLLQPEIYIAERFITNIATEVCEFKSWVIKEIETIIYEMPKE